MITDPGSELAALAAGQGFAATFENPPDIGGRYSALSLFGLVPALLAEADAAGLLASAAAMADRLRAAPAGNPAARLAATMAAGVRADKLTVLVPEAYATFGLWLEQLLAESTGKDGTGIVPVVGEPLGHPTCTATTGCSWRWAAPPNRRRFAALAAAGHPVAVLPAAGDFGDVGGQVMLWEMATAPWPGPCSASGHTDQPDVAAAKAATAKVLGGDAPGIGTTPVADCSTRCGPATTWPSRPSSTPAARSWRSKSRAPGAAGPPAGGYHRRPRSPVPALHRPAPQGRTRHRCVRPGGGGRPRGRADPRCGSTASPRSSTRRPTATSWRWPIGAAGPGGCARTSCRRWRSEDRHGGPGQDGRQHGLPQPAKGHEVVGYDHHGDQSQVGSLAELVERLEHPGWCG